MSRLGQALFLALAVGNGLAAERQNWAVRLEITDELPADFGAIPMDPEIDFGELIRSADGRGVLDPGSIRVTDSATGRRHPHSLSHEFEYGDRGRVQWVIRNPAQRVFEIRFATLAKRRQEAGIYESWAEK
jgi:hypothetical protein